MHSCDTLVGYWNPTPGKEPPTAVFFIAPNGAAARPAGRCEHTSFQPVNSPVYQRPQGRIAAPPVACSARQQSGPCRGIGGSPNKPILQVFAKAKIGKIAKCVPLCPACHY